MSSPLIIITSSWGQSVQTRDGDVNNQRPGVTERLGRGPREADYTAAVLC